MADISDIEAAMVQLVAGFLGVPTPYLPTGTATTTAFSGSVRIGRGWPTAGQLDTDLAAKVANVTVFPIGGMVRHTPLRFFQWRTGPAVTPTLTASVSGSTVTFGGTGSAAQVAGVALGAEQGRAAYAYRLTATDTPTSVAAALAAQIPNATASGAVLTVPTNLPLQASVAIDQPAWLETRRQQQGVWVMIWAPSPQVRDALGSAIDAGFAGMVDQWGRQTEFFGLPDGSDGKLTYAGSYTDDTPEQANLFRRNLKYIIEYPTTLLQQQPEVIFAGGPLNEGQFGVTLETPT